MALIRAKTLLKRWIRERNYSGVQVTGAQRNGKPEARRAMRRGRRGKSQINSPPVICGIC